MGLIVCGSLVPSVEHRPLHRSAGSSQRPSRAQHLPADWQALLARHWASHSELPARQSASCTGRSRYLGRTSHSFIIASRDRGRLPVHFGDPKEREHITPSIGGISARHGDLSETWKREPGAHIVCRGNRHGGARPYSAALGLGKSDRRGALLIHQREPSGSRLVRAGQF